MYNPKYQKGDAIIRRKDSIISFSSLPDITIIIDRVIDLNNRSTFYYTFKPDIEYVNMDQPLFPAVDVDNNYIYDEIYYRKGKLENIIYKTKVK